MNEANENDENIQVNPTELSLGEREEEQNADEDFSSLESLNDDSIRQVYQFLPIDRLAALSSTSRRFYELAQRSWKQKFLRDFYDFHAYRDLLPRELWDKKRYNVDDKKLYQATEAFFHEKIALQGKPTVFMTLFKIIRRGDFSLTTLKSYGFETKEPFYTALKDSLFDGLRVGNNVTISLITLLHHFRYQTVYDGLYQEAQREFKDANAEVDVHKKDKDGYTLFHWACYCNQHNEIENLLKIGSLPNQTTDFAETPLDIAIKSGHVAVVRQLLTHDVDININGDSSPLYIAVHNGHKAVVHLLLDEGAPINQAKSDGSTPLLLAVRKGHEAVIALLLEQGADVNQAMMDGVTPLYVAAQEGFKTVVQRLLEHGANINQSTSDNGATPLIVASFLGRQAVVEQLLKYGADVNQAMYDGKTPLDMAKEAGHKKITNLIMLARACHQPSKPTIQELIQMVDEYLSQGAVVFKDFANALNQRLKTPEDVDIDALRDVYEKLKRRSEHSDDIFTAILTMVKFYLDLNTTKSSRRDAGFADERNHGRLPSLSIDDDNEIGSSSSCKSRGSSI